jgi:spore germination cell wall hydrolase CwlJ-like protein
MRWICATAAPWALGAGLLVSFTASAGHDLQSGVSAARLSATAPLIDASGLIPPSNIRIGASPRLPVGGLVQEARLRFELPEEAEHIPAALPPREDLKAATGEYPSIDRSRKGDPIVALRPSLSRSAGDLRQAAGRRLLFEANDPALPAGVLNPGSALPDDLDGEPVLVPWQSPDSTMTRQATSAQSPAAVASGSTGPARGTVTRTPDGATPAVSRAMALSSTTPAPADATPIEIAAAPVSLPPLGASPQLDRDKAGFSLATKADPEAKPRYADLVNPDNLNSEQRCLAEAVYFEARSEPEEGQAAVAQVVLNRAKSGLYPSSICGVVYQNRHRHLACQFTFACEGKSLRITDGESWRTATRVATAVLEGKTYLAEVGASTHYHADYVRPRWARKLKKMDTIGRHIFYKLRPGQT